MREHPVRTITMLSVVAVALTFAGVVCATENATKSDTSKAKRHDLTGEITAVDATAGTLSVKKGDETVSLTIGKNCKVVTADKKDATVADLKVGDKVTVVYVEEDGAKVAKKIGPPRAPKNKHAPK
jgi:Cu/Ag efflux protein CusF